MSHYASSSQLSWFVVHTKPKQEKRALEELRNQKYYCFLPTVRIEKCRNRKIRVCEEPLFSRYLFIRLDRAASNWSSIRSTRGVSSLLTFGERYATLEDSWIDALQEMQSVIYQDLFKPGERVSIVSGPFAGLEGIFQEPDGDSRALIFIEMMSRQRKLRIPAEALRRTA